MTFRDQLDADALAVFCNPAELGELVTYYPDGRQGDPHEIMAVVDRRQLIPSQFGDGDGLIREATVHIPRSLIPEVTKGRDLVELVMVDGKPPAMALVTQVTDSDPGMWELVVTW